MAELEAAEVSAQEAHLNIWEYGVYSDDEEEDDKPRGRGRGGGRR
jgi:endonuclease YncB( thermonuclease family)